MLCIVVVLVEMQLLYTTSAIASTYTLLSKPTVATEELARELLHTQRAVTVQPHSSVP